VDAANLTAQLVQDFGQLGEELDRLASAADRALAGAGGSPPTRWCRRLHVE
jgi:hypothetical protein